MRFSFLLIILHFTFWNVDARETRIEGTWPEIPLSAIRVYTISDPVLEIKQILSEGVADKDGHFLLKFNISETKMIYLETRVKTFCIGIQPGYYYTLNPERPSAVIPIQTYNPAAIEVFHLLPESVLTADDKVQNPGNEINHIVAAYNITYESFLKQQLIRRYTPALARQKLDSFLLTLPVTEGSSDDTFILNYLEMSVVLLEYTSGFLPATEAFARAFRNEKFSFDSHITRDLFRQAATDFAGYFDLRHASHEYWDKLIDSLYSGSHLPVTISDLVLLDEVYRGFNSSGDQSEKLLGILDNMILNGSDTEIKLLAKEIRYRFTRLEPGSDAPVPVLEDMYGNKVSLADFRGYYIILNSCDPRLMTCQREFEYLRFMQGYFREKIYIISLVPEISPTWQEDIPLPGTSNWLFLKGNPIAHQEYNFLAYPSFILIDDQGIIIDSPALLPSEGLDKRLYEILNKKD